MNNFNSIHRLMEENERLLAIAVRDELTGIANRRAVEQAIRDALPDGGAMLVCDLDFFKRINDQFGHLKGDECLKKAAVLLSDSIRQQDLIGRIGGDEFVIFARGTQTEKTIDIIRTKIYKCFQGYSLHADVPLFVTIGGTVCRPGETYEDAFARADRQLLELKQKKRLGRSADAANTDPWIRDMGMIRSELQEQISAPYGSNCQDFESFKMIYRFLERCMVRNRQKATLILFSLSGENGASFSPAGTRKYMDLLGEILQRRLRMGDVYTQYSSCQYLVLLIDADEDTSQLVVRRIRDSFREQIPESCSEQPFLHYCSQLEAITTK